MNVRTLTVLVAALAACSDDPETGPIVSPAAGATIAIPNWPAGTTGVVRLHRNSGWTGAPLGEFAIDADGRFTYALGAPDGLMAFGEVEGLTVSPPDARYQSVVAALTLLDGDSSPTGELHVANRLTEMPGAGDTYGELFWVDRDVTIAGTASGCSYDQRLRRGWNYVLVHVTATDPYACEITASPGLPHGLGWWYEYIGI